MLGLLLGLLGTFLPQQRPLGLGLQEVHAEVEYVGGDAQVGSGGSARERER